MPFIEDYLKEVLKVCIVKKDIAVNKFIKNSRYN